MSNKSSRRPVIGWREWVALPELGIEAIKPKIDTGARSSAIHAVDLETYQQKGATWVRFSVHPLQRNSKVTVTTDAEVVEYRRITSSTGHRSRRPVIVSDVELMGQRWPIELTLANRDEMGFRMLLGRQALRKRFLVDPGQSYLAGTQLAPKRKPRRTKTSKRQKRGKE